MNEVGESVTVQIQHYIFSPLPFTFSVCYVQVHSVEGCHITKELMFPDTEPRGRGVLHDAHTPMYWEGFVRVA